MRISREEQDAYAKQSYERSQSAAAAGFFRAEIVPVQVPDRKAPGGFIEVTEDEEFRRVDFSRFPNLRTAFVSEDKGGTVTAANASTLNDGAAAMIISSAAFAAKHPEVKPLARIVGECYFQIYSVGVSWLLLVCF